ncbi:MAG: hypothetical protein AMJ56_00615 [Anaerolineae bacterium SG8_19]|nr:MAG: hypothetical protein AMJ56_00615 [Anaerolineae bacterium SG8_19]
MNKKESDELLKHAQDLSKISQAFHELSEGLQYEDRVAILVSLLMQSVLSNTEDPALAMAETANIFASMIFTIKQMAEMVGEEDEDENKNETRN